MFFRKKIPPLEQAIAYAEQATSLACFAMRDIHRCPTEEEVARCEHLRDVLLAQHVTVDYILQHVKMRQSLWQGKGTDHAASY